jgi:RNA polymerase sigma-70 factor (ECF subfamily)
MDELTLLRRLDADTPAPTRAALTNAFEALTDRMTVDELHTRSHAAPRRRRRTPRLRWAALTVAGAAALAMALVLTDTVGIAGLRPGATAQAAEVLHEAAHNTIRTSDPVVGKGQYLRVRTRQSSLNHTGSSIWREADVSDVYVPADRTANWYFVRSPAKATEYLTTGSKSAADAAYRRAIDARGFTGPRTDIAPGGDISGTGTTWRPDGIDLATLPTDPRVLLNRLYRAGLGAGTNPDQEAFAMTADILRFGLTPAKLRSALFQAVALIPGVEITDHAVTLDGRTGVAIGRTEPSTNQRQEIIIDPNTGRMIGEREYSTKPVRIGGATIRGQRAAYFSSVTTTVVDALPQATLEHTRKATAG